MMDFIDFRSDTVTIPTEEMLDAMRNAKAGDDVYQDDPTVKILEEKSAGLLEKEDALFVPSGTFGNQLAILTHTDRGNEVVIPADNHIVLYEVGAPAVIAGVQLRLLPGKNGIIDLRELEESCRGDDIHYPETGLICMENAHTNGTVVSLENIAGVSELARKKKIPLHLDGARIFNAAAALNLNPSEIAELFDSVMFCFSKGLCAPVGSILAGNKEFIKSARKNRKLMGGGMRQVGYIAAPCIISLDKMVKRLSTDHDNARYMAEKLNKTGFFDIEKDRLDINMVFFKLKEELSGNMEFDEERFISFLYKNKIKINPRHDGEFRFVTHYYTGRKEIDFAISLIKDYLESNT
jgi:threonine aldolase